MGLPRRHEPMKHATGEGEIYRASTAIARRPASHSAARRQGASDRLNSRRLVFMLSVNVTVMRVPLPPHARGFPLPHRESG